MAVLFKRTMSNHKLENSKYLSRPKSKKISMESIPKEHKKSRDKSLNGSHQFSGVIFRSANKIPRDKQPNSRNSPNNKEPVQNIAELNDKKIGNCLINNLYFIPKLHKKRPDSGRRTLNSLAGMAAMTSNSTRKLKKPNLSKLLAYQRKSMPDIDRC